MFVFTTILTMVLRLQIFYYPVNVSGHSIKIWIHVLLTVNRNAFTPAFKLE